MNGELFSLAVQGVGRKWRISLLLFVVLLLSFAFAIISLIVTGSIRRTNEEYRYDTFGTWYGAIPNGWESDEAFLREQAWLDELGITKSYGTIQALSSGSTSIGVMDETFLRIGRISLQDGRFPKNAGEIAMEADLLSALGYNYTLGQEITFTVAVPAGGTDIEVARTFTLCGIIQEYTDLWTRPNNLNMRPLNSAMITQEAAELLLQSAQETANGIPGTFFSAIVPQYHFTVLPGCEDTMVAEVNEYLKTTEHSDTRVSVNTAAFSTATQEEVYETFYVGLILAVTILSVICIYAIRIQDEVRQLAVFRSIGITKRQLCLMLLYETLCLGVPALVLGVGVGVLGTWALLRLALYSGSTPVQVAVSPTLLAAAAGLWLAGVLAARISVFLVALRAPLTGRFHIARKKARQYYNLQRALIVCLSMLLSAAVFFTALESLVSFEKMRSWIDNTDYSITRNGYGGGRLFTETDITSEEFYTEAGHTVPKQVVTSIAQIPGISRVWGYGKEIVRLSFEGMEDVPLTNCPIPGPFFHVSGPGKIAVPFGAGPYDLDALYTYLYIVDESDLEDSIDLGFDIEQYRAGDAVLMSFPVDASGRFVNLVIEETYTQTGISVGDTVTITIGTPEHYVDTQVTVVGIKYVSPEDRWPFSSYPYGLVCSEAFLEKLLDSLGSGQHWNVYRQGTPYGYGSVVVYADSNAGYLSTDTVMAEIAAREDLLLISMRELNDSYAQQYLQALILLLLGGGCVALMLLLILGNTLSMEGERQKRNCGVLQAIGMSRRQLRFQQLGAALLRSAMGVFAGWLFYGGYLLIYAVQEESKRSLTGIYAVVPSYKELFLTRVNSIMNDYGGWTTLLLLTTLCIALVLLVSWTAKRRLFREDLMAKLRDEH